VSRNLFRAAAGLNVWTLSRNLSYCGLLANARRLSHALRKGLNLPLSKGAEDSESSSSPLTRRRDLPAAVLLA